MEATYNGQNATLEYLVQSDGSIALTHVIQVQNEETSAWYEAFIDAHSGEILSVSDFVADASVRLHSCLCLRVFIVYIQYTVVPTTKHSFADGLETLVDPADLTSSPLGWHDAGFGNSTSTSYVANIIFDWLVLTLLRGNNVLAFKGQSVTAQTTSGLNFNDKYDDTLDPTDATNLNAARVNGFYILNVMHDFSYRYGFTEDKFNFQLNNFDNAGQENDRVLLSIQDPSGTDNANFATPPEYVCSPSG